MRIGILALQGAFAEHSAVLRSLGAETFEIRNLDDLNEQMDGIVIPGGESTVIGMLLNDLGMMTPLRKMISDGLPALGTCAGAIVLAEGIEEQDETYLATMPMTVRRNAYGRQLGSFTDITEFKGCGRIPMRFIRAPIISSIGRAECLAKIDGDIVAARYGNQMAMTFHPELSSDTSVHQMFLGICATTSK